MCGLISNAFLFIVGAFIVGSWLMWWFNTNLPIHVLQIIRALGYRKNDKEFWSKNESIEGIDDTFTLDLNDFASEDFNGWMEARSPGWLAELLSCPGCLSMHLSFWIAIIAQLVTWQFNPILFLACWWAWPSMGNLILRNIQR